MIDAMKEESVGFLFNVQVEAAPSAVAPVRPEGLAEFAGGGPQRFIFVGRAGIARLACAPRESTTK
jgi:hypothetical protein